MNNFCINKPNKSDEEIGKQKLYQILPIEYLDAILINKKIRFNNILKSWEDPYELFLFRDKTTNNSINKLKYSYFGQCWSTRKNSDAMWRIYSSDKRSVRIKTTLNKIIEATNGEYQARHVGWVKYDSQKNIKKFREEALQDPNWINNNDLIIESLFTKRNAFDHEKEVRIIFQKENFNEGKYIDFSIEPSDFIEEIAFDPRMDYQIFKCKKEIYGNLKLIKEYKIVRSDLYSLPGKKDNEK